MGFFFCGKVGFAESVNYQRRRSRKQEPQASEAKRNASGPGQAVATCNSKRRCPGKNRSTPLPDIPPRFEVKVTVTDGGSPYTIVGAAVPAAMAKFAAIRRASSRVSRLVALRGAALHRRSRNNPSACPVASFTMKDALLCSSAILGRVSRRSALCCIRCSGRQPVGDLRGSLGLVQADWNLGLCQRQVTVGKAQILQRHRY